ncbi:MAG: GFA family protein [Gammaproteobacteria bacterium]|nr:GFA family protein [Gammaproteobacteria bacterium]
MNDSLQQGHCLCGAVRFSAPPLHEIGMCHCGMCRRWAGGAPLVGGIAAAVTVTAGEALRWYASSSWGERGFCGECGGSLFWRQKGAAAGWLVCAAALPDNGALQLRQHIFIEDKPAYYDMADAAPRLTGAEFTAAVVAKMPPAKRAFVKTFIALDALKKRLRPPSPPPADGDRRGGCLCGGVRFSLPQAMTDAGICHCGQCRRWGGGAGVVCVDAPGATLESADTLRWHRTSEHSERGFCGSCGTPLFWRGATTGDGGAITEFCAGALQDDRNITVSRHIYVDDKPAYYDMAGDAERLTGAEYESRIATKDKE